MGREAEVDGGNGNRLVIVTFKKIVRLENQGYSCGISKAIGSQWRAAARAKVPRTIAICSCWMLTWMILKWSKHLLHVACCPQTLLAMFLAFSQVPSWDEPRASSTALLPGPPGIWVMCLAKVLKDKSRYPNLVRWAYIGHQKYCCTICWPSYVYLCLTMRIPKKRNWHFRSVELELNASFWFLTSQSAFTCSAYSKTSESSSIDDAS